MAEKRMLSKTFLNNASFMKMSDSAKLLYVYLNVNADDDGIVEAYPYVRMLGTPDDDVKILLAKEFLYMLNEDLLVFLPHWLQNQTLRTARYTPSIYRFKLLNSNPYFFTRLKETSIEKILKVGQTEMLRNDLIEKWYPSGLPKDNHGSAQIRSGQIRSDQISQEKGSLVEVREDQSTNLSDDTEDETVRKNIKDQIGYDALKFNYRYKRIVDDVLNTIQYIYSEKSQKYKINGEEKSAKEVKMVVQRLNQFDIENAIESFIKVDHEIMNPLKYWAATLYNCKITKNSIAYNSFATQKTEVLYD
ncbi:DNA replication protein [Enterococcus lactis]|uniref:DNA replication protein n=1 Tax=Enterococcus lactis TaxID=357441 RepID=UPI0039083BA4